MSWWHIWFGIFHGHFPDFFPKFIGKVSSGYILQEEIESGFENVFFHVFDAFPQDFKFVFGGENVVVHFGTLAIFLPGQSHVDVGSRFER